jgi:hypothetical protein
VPRAFVSESKRIVDRPILPDDEQILWLKLVPQAPRLKLVCFVP